MAKSAHHYLNWIKLTILLVHYVPYSLFLAVGERSWIMLVTGLYLTAGFSLRNFALSGRLGARGATAWVLADTIVWALSMHLTGWAELNFAASVLGADAVRVGWPYRRGVPHVVAMALVIALVRAVAWPGFRPYLGNFGFILMVGALFVYGLVSLAESMRTEREAADHARREADLARQQAEHANGQLREYARQVEELAVLRERNRLAREVHDVIAHTFTGMIMQVEAVQLLLAVHPEQAAARLQTVQERARDGLGELRRSVHALRPLQMEEGRGPKALAQIVHDFGATTGMEASFTASGQPVELPVGHELCLFRAVQEGLANALSHGAATVVQVSLTYRGDGVALLLTDNGRGDSGAAAHGLGLVGMRERAAALGGTVAVGQAPTGGFQVEVRLPYPSVGAL